MPHGFSLHIGLNSVDPAYYDGWDGPLIACEADAHAMDDICAKRGFQTEKLLTGQATRQAVLQRLDGYAHNLAEGDTLIVSYSGHGGQLPDKNKDESDGLDETWCLFDGEMVDDELYAAWAKFPAGVRIAVFSDSCHSGTVLRNAVLARGLSPLGSALPTENSFRAMPPEIQYRTYSKHRRFYDELLARDAPRSAPDCTVVLVSGCQDNQLSSDGPFNGAFTGSLLAVWSDGDFKGGYPQLTKAVQAKLPSTQSPNFMLVGPANDGFVNGQVFSC